MGEKHEPGRSSMRRPFSFTAMYPSIAWWVTGRGWIEIGENEDHHDVVRLMDEGGTVWEGKIKNGKLDQALNELEKSAAKFIEENLEG